MALLSRETRVHAAVLALSVVTFWALSFAVPAVPVESPLVLLAFYALWLGGGHLYLAWRGADGTVPVRSRWRYLGFLAGVLALAALALTAPGARVGPAAVGSVAPPLAALLCVAYWLLEARDGYLSAGGSG